MSMIISQPAQAISLPAPRVAIDVRPATLDDFAFIDRLQTAYCKQLGYMPRAQMESKIRAGHVLVAEVERDETKETRVGFVMGCDRYFKRDDCGIIYQLCVEEGQRRSLVGAMLVKAMFDRAAYGCRLFCCWCAQDIEANRFWESLGFVPLAFRAGSRKKGRVHIFWQKRIRPGDTSTPWWFPAKTDAGAIREDRLVLPIPPGLHWSEPMPVVLPAAPASTFPLARSDGPRGREPSQTDGRASARGAPGRSLPPRPGFSDAGRLRLMRARIEQQVRRGELPISALAEAMQKERAALQAQQALARAAAKPVKAKKPLQRKPAKKADPRLAAMARELRDRWLEEVERDPTLLLSSAKYDVCRALPEPIQEARVLRRELPALPQAA